MVKDPGNFLLGTMLGIFISFLFVGHTLLQPVFECNYSQPLRGTIRTEYFQRRSAVLGLHRSLSGEDLLWIDF